MRISKTVSSYRPSKSAPLAMLLVIGQVLAGASYGQNVRVGDSFPGQISLGELPSGGTITIEFEVVVNSTVPAGVGEVCNQGTLRGLNFVDLGTDDPAVGGAADPTCTPLEAEPDLKLVKDYAGGLPSPGATIDFTLAFANLGDQGATGVVIADTVPLGTTFNPGASAAGWACVPDATAGSVCTLAIGPLAAAGNGVTVFAVDFNDPPTITQIDNCATISDDGTNGADPSSADNTGCETVSLDSVPPQVTIVNTVADTGDGVLAECETARVKVSRLVVSFDEDMKASMGAPGPNDADNPANYLLVTPGANFDFETVDCLSGIQGDDVGIPFASVTYSSPKATLHLGAGQVLADSLHRLLVCDSLRDLGGNALDGDGNGTGGDDFVRSFRVDAANLLANGHFDCTLAGWTASPPADVAHDPLSDADGSPHSGAALVTSSDFMFTQCVPVTAGFDYELAGSVQLVATASPVTLLRSCEFYAAAGCQGTLLATAGDLDIDSITGSWEAFDGEVPAPAGAASARCAFSLEGTNFDALLDGLSLSGDGDEIFADGFESGNTSAWSSSLP